MGDPLDLIDLCEASKKAYPELYRRWESEDQQYICPSCDTPDGACSCSPEQIKEANKLK